MACHPGDVSAMAFLESINRYRKVHVNVGAITPWTRVLNCIKR